MGGPSPSTARGFVDSVERECRRRLLGMKVVYSVDPTPALAQRIEEETASSERKINLLRAAHERFEELMALPDSELARRSSSERAGPVFGDPKLVRKIIERKMGEREYDDLINGPDLS